MKIAFMHRQLDGGGTEADLLRMAAGLAERGHEMHLFCARPAHSMPGALRVHRVPVLRMGRVARLLSFAFAAPALVARQRFDLVVGFGRTIRQDVVRVGGGTHQSYLALMRATGARRRGLGPYHRAILWIERRMFSPAGHRMVLAVSRRAGAEVAADYGVASGRIRVVYNGVDLDAFHPRHVAAAPAIRRELGLESDDRLCLAVGSGFVRKGFDLLVELWRRDPPGRAHLALVGRDERLASFRRSVARGGRVHVLGHRDDVPALMASADVSCVPSRQEAFGNVVLEAMASGTPVVTSRLVGAAELIAPPLDALVIEQPDDLPALHCALEDALGPTHGAYAAAARAQAAERPWSRHIDEVARLFEEARHG